MDIIMSWVPFALLCWLIIAPYGMLANETYRAVYKVNKVPVGLMILHYVPFFNYIKIRSYLYGKSLPTAILSIITGLCLAFRALAIILWASTDPIMMVYSVWVAIAGVAMWYITMAFTSCYTCVLTRRGVVMTILGTVIAPFGAFIVSKNIRKYFKKALEDNNEFRVTNGAG